MSYDDDDDERPSDRERIDMLEVMVEQLFRNQENMDKSLKAIADELAFKKMDLFDYEEVLRNSRPRWMFWSRRRRG